MKEKVVRYVVKYPYSSEDITKTEMDASFRPIYSRDDVYAVTWSEAHSFLQRRALERVDKANAELGKALEHLGNVMALKDPDEVAK